MKRVWNVSASPLVVDNERPAVMPGECGRFDDAVAAGLLVSPDWTDSDPRQPVEPVAEPVSAEPAE